MPADQETIRYTGFYGNDANGKPFLSREVLGRRLRRALLRRRQRRHPHRAGFAQPAGRIHRDALSADGREAGACAPIPAAPASGAAVWVTRSIIARWSIAAPSSPPTACGSAVTGSTAARPGSRSASPSISKAKPRDLGGLVDGEPVRSGQVVRVVTTGGGGWGDPLAREPDCVMQDVIEGPRVTAKAHGMITASSCAGDGDELWPSMKRRPPNERERAPRRSAPARCR